MLKVICGLSFILICACNSRSSEKNTNDSTAAASTNSSVASSWSKEDEQEFMASCVDNSKASMGDTAAYAYCKCVLGKVQQRFPTLDSTIVVLNDTTEAAKITAGCK
jgi:hypothetical protein